MPAPYSPRLPRITLWRMIGSAYPQRISPPPALKIYGPTCTPAAVDARSCDHRGIASLQVLARDHDALAVEPDVLEVAPRRDEDRVARSGTVDRLLDRSMLRWHATDSPRRRTGGRQK